MMSLSLDALLKCQGQVGAVAVADDLPKRICLLLLHTLLLFMYVCICVSVFVSVCVCVRMAALRLRQLGTANQVCVQSLLFSFAQ